MQAKSDRNYPVLPYQMHQLHSRDIQLDHVQEIHMKRLVHVRLSLTGHVREEKPIEGRSLFTQL